MIVSEPSSEREGVLYEADFLGGLLNPAGHLRGCCCVHTPSTGGSSHDLELFLMIDGPVLALAEERARMVDGQGGGKVVSGYLHSPGMCLSEYVRLIRGEEPEQN